jgi:hypothetical protein
MEIQKKEWMTPILFEGIELSPISVAIDHLGMYGNLPELSEETSKWLWEFTICQGIKKNDKGKIIHKHISETLLQTNTFRDHLLKNVPNHFDGKFSEVHLDMWINDLETMLEACKNKDECSWTVK